MRLKFSAMVFGIATYGFFPAPVMAQTQNTYVPLYNTAGTPYYSATQGGVPVYNNNPNAPILPMDQMVAGKNAPSYDYNQTSQAYTFGATTNGSGTSQAALTPQQQAQLEAQYQAQLQAQQAYLNSIAQQQTGNDGLLTGGPFGTAPVGDTGASGQAATKQRRVVYRDINNPLSAPPRLFNPDQ